MKRIQNKTLLIFALWTVAASLSALFPLLAQGETWMIAKKEKDKDKDKDKKSISPQENHLSPKRDGKIISRKFKIPPDLKPAVEFWKIVYSKYDRNYEIFHDTENLGVVYSVLDFTDLYNNDNLTSKERKALFFPRLEAEETRIKNLLLAIHEKQYRPESLSPEEKRIYDLFKDNPDPDKFLTAADDKRIRAQTGIKDKFIEAVRISGAYLEEIEDIFMNYGLPIELTRMIFVESMFDLRARSKVGASGIWQFMPTTGRLYGLEINRYTDERNDPLLATHAAARLLLANYDALGTWPLAINAYNSGRATMRRAVEAMETEDISTIINGYRGGVYGFASRNFYPSFLAALEIANHYPKYFGEISRDEKFVYDSVINKKPVILAEFALTSGLEPQDVSLLNPHFSDKIHQNKLKIPTGFLIRVPLGARPHFTQGELIKTRENEKTLRGKNP